MNVQIRVLIIDKSIDCIKLISHCLYSSKKNEFVVEFCGESSEGLQSCLTNAYDIIFIGNEVEGEVSGVSFLQKTLNYGCKTPVVFLDNDENDMDKVLQIGAADFLIKKEINIGLLERSVRYSIERGKIQYEAEHDKLTGLLNRKTFLDELQNTLMKGHKDAAYTYGVLFIDVDRFKYVNDTLGHNMGDELLIAIGKKIRSCLHRLDIVSRYGGDEFAILLTGMSRESIEVYAYKLKNSFNTPMFVMGYEFSNTVSVGVVVGQGNIYSTPQEIIRDADIAMYHNKNKDKDKPIFFDLKMRGFLERRFYLENELRKAIQNNQFQVYYQPIIDAHTNKILSMEALLRWKLNDIWIPPDEFIPLAEELYLIHNLTEIVLKRTVKDMKSWTFPYFLSISINLSPKQLSNPNIVELFLNELNGIDQNRIVIEITESSLMNGNKKSCEENINKFKSNGFKIHLDDFGTGYSALGHIINFPLDGIKIDKSFITSLNNKTNMNVVKTIIELSHGLGLYVVAEGVETDEQITILKQLNCDSFQGFGFYKPMPNTEIAKLFNLLRDYSSSSSSSSSFLI